MRKYVFIIAAIIIVLLVFTAKKDVDEMVTQFDFTEKNFDKDDSLILKKGVLSKMKVLKFIKSKKRNPLKLYKYNDKYNFYATKINLKSDGSLDEIISFNNDLTSADSFVTYVNLESTKSLDVQFNCETLSPVSKIIFSLSGDEKQLKKIVHNKDFISYSMPLSTMSLQYESKSNPTDVFVFANGSNLLFRKKIPFVVSFYKKEKSIYLLLMTPIKKEAKMNPDIFEEIIEY